MRTKDDRGAVWRAVAARSFLSRVSNVSYERAMQVWLLYGSHADPWDAAYAACKAGPGPWRPFPWKVRRGACRARRGGEGEGEGEGEGGGGGAAMPPPPPKVPRASRRHRRRRRRGCRRNAAAARQLASAHEKAFGEEVKRALTVGTPNMALLSAVCINSGMLRADAQKESPMSAFDWINETTGQARGRFHGAVAGPGAVARQHR